MSHSQSIGGSEHDPLGASFAELVDALYLSLLGRGPDPEGREHWVRVGSVEAVVRALVATDEFHRRAIFVLGGSTAVEQRHLRAATRLQHHRGCGPVGHLPPGVSTIDVLSTLPWSEVISDLALTGASGAGPRVQMLGPYARELCSELQRRVGGVRAVAGLQADPAGAVGDWSRDERRVDVLVLSDPDYLEALVWSLPLELDRVDRRLLMPLALAASGALGDLAAHAPRLRRRLHELGFVEVRSMFARRFGDALVHLDTSHVTPDLDRPRVVVHTEAVAASLPAAVWFVADRLPRCELR